MRVHGKGGQIERCIDVILGFFRHLDGICLLCDEPNKQSRPQTRSAWLSALPRNKSLQPIFYDINCKGKYHKCTNSLYAQCSTASTVLPSLCEGKRKSYRSLRSEMNTPRWTLIVWLCVNSVTTSPPLPYTAMHCEKSTTRTILRKVYFSIDSSLLTTVLSLSTSPLHPLPNPLHYPPKHILSMAFHRQQSSQSKRHK